MQILSLIRTGATATVVYADASGIRQKTLSASLTDAEIAAAITPAPAPVPAPAASPTAKKRSRRS